MINVKALRGTKDIFYPEIEVWRSVIKAAFDILSLANYKEIQTPILENVELFLKGLGEVTDIVQKEMYSFTDKGKREITLRPEGTASVARAFIEYKLYTKTSPQRFWYVGPMFRYERPQAGRQRQFHQLGIECIGENAPEIDVECICLAVEVFKKLGLKDLSVSINSLGQQTARKAYTNALTQYLDNYTSSLSPEFVERLRYNPLRILDSKDPNIQVILEKAPSILNFLDKDSLDRFELICQYLKSLSIPYQINHQLVRGLDYYNDTIFEIKSNDLGAQNTICGGGRYDRLIECLGGPSTPAMGWAIGLERLILLLSRLDISTNARNTLDCYIIAIGDKAKATSLQVSKNLREYNIQVETSYTDSSLNRQLKKANQLNAKSCIIIGDNEIENDYITLKYLDKKIQEQVSIKNFDLIAHKIKGNSVYNMK